MQTTTEGYLAAGIGAMALAVGTLWKWVSKSYTMIQRRLDACEGEKTDLWKAIAKLEAKSCGTGHCDARVMVKAETSAKRPK